jgi:Zn-dependent peptidase ImmA (M78 family)
MKTNIGGQTGRLFLLVELLAQKYLEMGKFRCPPVPTALIGLIDQRGITEIRSVPLKAYHGAIWHPKEGWIIQVKADDSPTMKRFTLFHEAFHILAHYRTTPVFRKRGAIRGSFNELLADHFAVCILMPRQWVREKWAEVKDLDRISVIFDAPKSAVCIRLRQLGLV